MKSNKHNKQEIINSMESNKRNTWNKKHKQVRKSRQHTGKELVSTKHDEQIMKIKFER